MSRPATHLIVASPETPSNVLVIQNLNLEAEVLLQILYQHDQERQFDAQSFGWVSRARDVCSADIGAHDLQHARPNIIVSDPFDVSVANCKASNHVCIALHHLRFALQAQPVSGAIPSLSHI